jgi:hypothetical protein
MPMIDAATDNVARAQRVFNIAIQFGSSTDSSLHDPAATLCCSASRIEASHSA